MNEQSKDMLMKYLELGAQKLESGAEFLESEIPLVVSEYLNWVFYSSLLNLVGGVILICLSITLGLIIKLNKKNFEEDYDDNLFLPFLFLVIGSIFFLVTGSIQCCISTRDLVKVSVAPRVVILEKISEISK